MKGEDEFCAFGLVAREDTSFATASLILRRILGQSTGTHGYENEGKAGELVRHLLLRTGISSYEIVFMK